MGVLRDNKLNLKNWLIFQQIQMLESLHYFNEL